MAAPSKKLTRLPAERAYGTCTACFSSDDGLTERQKGIAPDARSIARLVKQRMKAESAVVFNDL
jgi:hypothetical protein